MADENSQKMSAKYRSHRVPTVRHTVPTFLYCSVRSLSIGERDYVQYVAYSGINHA
jgi:hypothetical protein